MYEWLGVYIKKQTSHNLPGPACLPVLPSSPSTFAIIHLNLESRIATRSTRLPTRCPGTNFFLFGALNLLFAEVVFNGDAPAATATSNYPKTD